MQGLAKEYETIWYFTLPTTKGGIEKCLATLPEAMKRKFRIYNLENTL